MHFIDNIEVREGAYFEMQALKSNRLQLAYCTKAYLQLNQHSLTAYPPWAPESEEVLCLFHECPTGCLFGSAIIT